MLFVIPSMYLGYAYALLFIKCYLTFFLKKNAIIQDISCSLWCWSSISRRFHFQYTKCHCKYLSARFFKIQSERIQNCVKTFILSFRVKGICHDFLEVIFYVLFATFGASIDHWGGGWWWVSSGHSRREPCGFGYSFQKINKANHLQGELYWYFSYLFHYDLGFSSCAYKDFH